MVEIKHSRDSWDIKVPIKKELLKTMPFDKIQSRNALGVMLSFLDYHYVVVYILQRISHSMRSYIWNAHGLQGFLIRRPEIMKIL